MSNRSARMATCSTTSSSSSRGLRPPGHGCTGPDLANLGYSHIDNGQTKEGRSLGQALAIAAEHDTASLPLVLYAKAGSDLRMGLRGRHRCHTRDAQGRPRQGDAFGRVRHATTSTRSTFSGYWIAPSPTCRRPVRHTQASARERHRTVALADGELARVKGDHHKRFALQRSQDAGRKL